MMTNWKHHKICCRIRLLVGFYSMLLYPFGCTNLKSAEDFSQDTDSGKSSEEVLSSSDSDAGSPYNSSSKKPFHGEDSGIVDGILPSQDVQEKGVDTEIDGGIGISNDPMCPNEGTLRCTSVGSSAREICREGIWVTHDPCATDEICDTSNLDQPGSCVNASIACRGSADQLVCFKGVMHECNSDAISVSQQTCKSKKHCQIGLSNGQCAECIAAEEYRCEGVRLEVCADDGMEFELLKECDSADMCNTATRSCKGDATCSPEDYACEQGMLRGCNADQTGFEDLKPCEAGLCDMDHGECDICVFGENICMDGNRATCSDDGQAFNVRECEPPQSICTGAGVCVECLTVDDCRTEEPCRKPDCSLNQCTTAFDVGASCGAGNRGVCNEIGDCVECLYNSNCAAPTPFCNTERNECTECLSSYDCDESEECTDGHCLYTPGCGNGILETGEQCDDGNLQDQDGCPSTCRAVPCTPSWRCLNVSIEYCTCNSKEWCVHNHLEGSESKWGCALKCETDADCPFIGYPTKCIMLACLVPCRNDNDCPEGLKCRSGYLEEYGEYSNCGL